MHDQLWRWSTLTGPVILVSQTKMSLSIWQIVVPSTALLYPAYKNNNQMHGGLGWVCATGMYRSIGRVEFPKCQTGILVAWKRLRATTFPQFMKQFAASSKQGCKYRKILKISPGLIFFKGPFWGAYFWRGLSTEGNLHFKIDWASRIVGSKFTVFALFYFVFDCNFPSTSPRGLIFGGAI